MKILRLSTLSLTLAIAVVTLGYVNPSSAGKPNACNEDPPHPSCKDDPVSSITYTAQLTGPRTGPPDESGVPTLIPWAFEIPVRDVVLEGQDHILRSGDPVTIVRDVSMGPLQTTWDDVFDFCSGLLVFPVDQFLATAAKKGWTIERPGGVQVRFGVIRPTLLIASFPSSEGPLDVTLSLIGDCSYSSDGLTDCEPFPPEPGQDFGHGMGVSEIPLISFKIHAR